MYKPFLVFTLMLSLAANFLFTGCTTDNNGNIVAQHPPKTTTRPDRVAGEYIVTGDETSTSDSIAAIFSQYQVTLTQQIQPGTFLVRLGTDPGVEQLQALVETHDALRSIQPNYRYYPQSTPKLE